MDKQKSSETEELLGTVSIEDIQHFQKKVNKTEQIGKTDRPIALTEFSFEPTHICPLGKNCPEGSQNRCNICSYAIRSVRHIPAIKIELHRLHKELIKTKSHIATNKILFTKSEVMDLNNLKNCIDADICGLKSVLNVLEEQVVPLRTWQTLRQEWESNNLLKSNPAKLEEITIFATSKLRRK
jgi:hypothetical protein